jgi:hypothetical protein
MASEQRLIDANALLEKAYLTHPATMVNPYGGDYVVSVEHIENAPTVDAVEVVHGRWIPKYKMNWWIGTQDIDGFTCNQCARHFKSKLRLNYCPNCGAKMDGNSDVPRKN